ncbi:MAG TPA: hypothetical protein VM840_01070 [Actinomycetota bacterium]|nr:hypothetical protein [Actinomycetota bacterium]
MILDVNPENLRDIAAAVHAAHKREPGSQVLSSLERIVLSALHGKERILELDREQAEALRGALLKRAWDQRNTSEGFDYADLADRIDGALDAKALPREDVLDEG